MVEEQVLTEQATVVGGSTKVLIVDDHHVFSDLLTLALENESDFSIVGSAANAKDGIQLAIQTRPHMVVMDIFLGADDGLEATRRIRELLPQSVLVIVSAHCDAASVAKAASAGANAFAPKSGSLTEMLSILRQARGGAMLVAPSVYRQAAELSPATAELSERLTSRERDVLGLMGEGIPPAQIARILNISLHTCRGYVKAIHIKLGARSQLEAVVKAQQLGLLPSQ